MYESKRIAEVNSEFFRGVRDLGARDKVGASRIYEIPLLAVNWIMEKTDEEIAQLVKHIKGPVVRAAHSNEELWSFIIAELDKPEETIKSEKLSIYLNT